MKLTHPSEQIPDLASKSISNHELVRGALVLAYIVAAVVLFLFIVDTVTNG